MRQRMHVMHNDFHVVMTPQGLPEGHVPLMRHLGVPVLDDGKLRMILGVGNKAVDCDAWDTKELLSIGNDPWRIFLRRRTEVQLVEAKAAADSAMPGQHAVTLAAQSLYDLVLMDMQMPVMDGLQATRHIRALPGHVDTPIVAMTAHAFSEDRQRCMAAGMNDCIAEPFEPARL